MTDEPPPEAPPEPPAEIGWRVVDPAGNVVQSGTGVVMQAASGDEE